VGKIIKFHRIVNNVNIEQRKADGFINATAMCVAHGKNISDWLKLDDTWELVVALADSLGIKPNCHKNGNSVYTRVSASYPSLAFVKRGSPENGGGTWLHPDLALQLAQWCNKPFAIQVSQWLREWLTSRINPIQPDFEEEYIFWQRRYGERLTLKDELRPELMNLVVIYAKKYRISPHKLCSEVHDAMNVRIQGLKSKQIRAFNKLPVFDLLRDYFTGDDLSVYSAINKLAINSIQDRDIHPIDAVNDACDRFLGMSYTPKALPVVENLYKAEKRINAGRTKQRYLKPTQLNLFDNPEAM
jgi:hypothetical protein